MSEFVIRRTVVRPLRATAIAIFSVAVVAAVGITPAYAISVTRYVATPANGGSDANPCTSVAPCETLQHALAGSLPGDAINVGPGTFMANVTLSSDHSTDIVGSGVGLTILDGGGTGTVIRVAPTAPGAGPISISDLTVQHGLGGSGRGLVSTGGIAITAGAVSLDGVNVTNNVGFGVWNEFGQVTVSSSTVSDSTLTGFVNWEGVATVANSTFASNDVSGIDDEGGGTYTNVTVAANAGSGFTAGYVSGAIISGSTIARNGGAGIMQGFFISDTGGGVSAVGSIVSGNTGGNCVILDHPFTDLGYNLESDAAGSCGFSSAMHSAKGVNPQLGPLGDNGGPTQTIKPIFASPAIDAIPNPTTVGSTQLCPGSDQRGVARPQGLACDMGAVETATAPSAPTALTASPRNAAAVVTWTAPRDGGSAITGYTVTPFVGYFALPPSVFGPGTTTQTISGLTNGTKYSFKVAAKNDLGSGPTSLSSAQLVVGSPSAPGAVHAVRIGPGTLRVTFVPGANNGSAITGYRASCTSTNGGITKTAQSTSQPSTVSGLTSSETYVCRVSAKNANGTGPASSPSAPVTS